MLFVTNLMWNNFTSLKTVKHMLYLHLQVLLPYILIYNLAVSLNFHLTVFLHSEHFNHI